MHKKSGFTLIEILIVVAILAILTLTAIYSITHNLAKSRDARRKADLDRLKIAMEDYYGDKNEYPPDGSLSGCDSETLKPYLSSVPCDPKTKQPYCYIYDATAPEGQNYRLLATLENQFDDAIDTLGCGDDSTFCGYETSCSTYGSGYNYGVSSSDVTVLNPSAEAAASGDGSTVTPTPTPTPTSTPTPTPNQTKSWACGNFVDIGGVCGEYSNPTLSNCRYSFPTYEECTTYCQTSPIDERCTN